MADFIIDDDNAGHPSVLDGGAKGCVPRDFAVQPRKMQAVDFPLIPQVEWSARVKEMELTQSRLSDIRMTADNGSMMVNLDQGQFGYCWAHSTTHAAMLLRAKANLPYVPLSAFGVAATIKDGANEGGWGALSLQFAADRGIPSQAAWPQGDADPSRGTPACWADAAKYKVSEQWADLSNQVWDRHLTFAQVATLLLSRVPVVLDLNWWGHSVCGMDLVETSAGQFGIRILNSWLNWGDNGTAVLVGQKAIPDAAVAPLVMLA